MRRYSFMVDTIADWHAETTLTSIYDAMFESQVLHPLTVGVSTWLASETALVIPAK